MPSVVSVNIIIHLLSTKMLIISNLTQLQARLLLLLNLRCDIGKPTNRACSGMKADEIAFTVYFQTNLEDSIKNIYE